MIARIYRVLCACFSALAARLRFARKSNSDLIAFIWEDTQKGNPTHPVRFRASAEACGKRIRLYACLSPDFKPLDAKATYEWYFVVKEDMDRDPFAFQCGRADSIDEAKDIAEAMACHWIQKQRKQIEV